VPSLARPLVCSDSSQFPFWEASGYSTSNFQSYRRGAEVPMHQGFPLDGMIAQVYLKVRIETIRSTCARSSLPGIIFS